MGQNENKHSNYVMASTRALTLLTVLSLITGCVFEDQGTTTVGQPSEQTSSTPPDFETVPVDDGLGNPVGEVPTTTTLPYVPPAGDGRWKYFDGADLVINDGASYTKLPELELNIFIDDFSVTEMKLGSSDDCSDGAWESFKARKYQTVTNKNSHIQVSVQFRDEDKTMSQCVVRSILHDDAGPQILFTKYPNASLEVGSSALVGYSVTDISAISSITCKLNNLAKPCSAGTNEVSITSLPEGAYTFSIEAQDEIGNSSKSQISWNVVSTSKHLLQNILVNNYNKVDILIVDDNSGSMAYEQKSMAKRLSNFLSILSGLDWRIAVTTTDVTSTSAVNDGSKSSGLKGGSYQYVSDGLFIPISGLPGQFYLDSTMNPSDAQLWLGKTIQRTETGSSSEQAIKATYRTIERALTSTNPVQKNFFRDGAQFAVLVISDEDESANGTKNDPQNLVDHVRASFNGQKAFSWHSIITKPGDKTCWNGEGEVYGERYKVMSELTGGVIGSVCEADYAAQLVGVAEEIRQLVRTLTLSCAPLADRSVVVKKDNVVYPGAFVRDGVNLKFTDALPPGQYSVEYHCLK